MDILSQKNRSRTGPLMKFLGSTATLALVLQLMLGGFFSLNDASAQVADGSITVNKVVVGGPNVVADFALFVDGMPVVSGVATTTLDAGLHVVSETNLPGYTAVFSGDCNADGEVTLAAGGTATCTITNTFATTTATTSSLTVTKVVDGGLMEVDDFPLFVDGIPVLSGVATTTLGEGTFTITETNLPGYSATFSGDCDADGEITLTFGDDLECTITNTFTPLATTSSLTVNKVVSGGTNVVADFPLFIDGVPVVSGVATTTLGAGTFTITETNLPGYTATFSGDCNADGEVTLTATGTAECTITNTFATSTATSSSLTVTKVVVGGPNDVDDFPLFVNGVPVTSGVATTTLGAGAFVITETNLPGYTATFSEDCSALGVVNLALGDDLECVITNTFATTTATTSSLTVTKVVVGGEFDASDFPLFVNGVPVTSGVATTTLGSGFFTVTEANATGYTATFSGDCNIAGVVNLSLGADLDCVITNTFSTSTAATSSPIIDLEGESVINIRICDVDAGEIFVDPGFSVVDSAGIAITGTSTGTVNLNAAGTYTITYTATDAAGNTATTTRTVIVANCSSGGGGGGGQTNRGIERAAAVTPPGTAIAGQGLGLNTFQTFFLPPGQVLGAQSQFRGQVLGAQSYLPGMPSTGGEPLDNKFPNSLSGVLLALLIVSGIGVIATRSSSSSSLFSDRN